MFADLLEFRGAGEKKVQTPQEGDRDREPILSLAYSTYSTSSSFVKGGVIQKKERWRMVCIFRIIEEKKDAIGAVS